MFFQNISDILNSFLHESRGFTSIFLMNP